MLSTLLLLLLWPEVRHRIVGFSVHEHLLLLLLLLVYLLHSRHVLLHLTACLSCKSVFTLHQ
jgi:hypothetical protein